MPPARSNAARSTPQRSAPQRTAPSRSGAQRSAARAQAQPRARAATGFQPRRVKSRAPLSGIRWDRAQRLGLVAVLAIIGYLWVTGISSLLHSHAQAERGLVQVHRLALQNAALIAEQKSLHRKATILSDARGLGMVKQGEQSFIVTH